VVGIDLGLKTLATTSDGKKYDNTRITNKYAEKLAKAQRANNKKQTRNIHAKIKNVRSDYLHKLSSELIKSNSIIFVGDVNSAKLGKTRMAKSVYDASWATLREMLRYKASRHGVQYRVINESFTSQTCSACGSLPSSRPKGIAGLGIRDWVCSDCGASHDRDVNAAKNILGIGLSTQPPVEESRVS
jgi:IS605 OrfB family transposase